MRIFEIIFTSWDDEGENKVSPAEAVHANFPDVYELSSTVFLVRSDSLSSKIAEAVHIKGENRMFSGVVFKLNNSYSGFAARDLWEWLDKTEAS